MGFGTPPSKEIFARCRCCRGEMVVNRLSSLLGDFEFHRMPRLALTDGCAVHGIAVRRHVLGLVMSSSTVVRPRTGAMSGAPEGLVAFMDGISTISPEIL